MTDMSMLSAQCDELRERAKTLRQGRWSDGADDARLMEDAADTIDRLDAENAKLRELVRDYEHCSMHADCDSCKYDGTTSTHCPFSPCFPDIDELRELGVEVDA